MKTHLKYSIIAFIGIAFVLWYQKPSLMFDEEQQMRPFGIGHSKTIFYYPFIILITGMISYFIFLNIGMRRWEYEPLQKKIK